MVGTREEVIAEFARIVAEVVDAEFDMLAIEVILVNKDRKVSTKYAWDKNGNFCLLAETNLLQDNIIKDLQEQAQAECTCNDARS